ncbi:hypothetical protein PENTCL1PPCAC_19349, partial [Pristionchus entomophagus]
SSVTTVSPCSTSICQCWASLCGSQLHAMMRISSRDAKSMSMLCKLLDPIGVSSTSQERKRSFTIYFF